MATKTLSTRPPVTASAKSTKTPSKKTNLAVSSKASNSKTKAKPNGSILNFFKKAEQGLFLEGPGLEAKADEEGSDEVGWCEQPEREDRFHENGGSVKRRRLHGVSDGAGEVEGTGQDVGERAGEEKAEISGTAELGTEDLRTVCSPPPPDIVEQSVEESKDLASSTAGANEPPKPFRRIGPFLDDSESEEEGPVFSKKTPPQTEPTLNVDEPPHSRDGVSTPRIRQEPPETAAQLLDADEPPPFKHEATAQTGVDGFDEFGDAEDFDDDFLEGEEYVERRWMEEQRRLEMVEGGFEGEVDDLADGAPDEETAGDDSMEGINHAAQSANNAPGCPICDASLDGITEQDASVHVNSCLDGNPTPLPQRKLAPSATAAVKTENGRRVPRLIRPAKPGQENPFVLGGAGAASSSAFSKLMSSHAEDAAWATAAAAEQAARGKPAYQRTCPFYKILPGFSICVDAFRYGAVQGCQAYFLSHFHSDHYIGLTSTWCHGPIYCSRVTANLVRQQLRVDAKWVIGLDFENKVEVPGTDGVHVTMIPANHCPGSSLYLFEKVVGKGNNPKTQRVLHCGDFRACPAHVEHPLLRPDVVDAVSGKQRQQKLDVCYLDTTYLNPKYAFPSQEEVIKACADMCVSLSKVRADDTDGWEQMKRDRAGEGMVKFVKKEPDIKQEEGEDDADAMKITAQPGNKPRGRLLVVVGTYSIGKERICLGIARALNSKIYAPPGKQRICACLEDAELDARLTSDPREAQVHMTPLFEIRADTLDDYLKDYRDAFTRAVGFRPSGWNYRPPNSRFVESPAVQTVLRSANWRSGYSMRDLVPQRGSTSRASCFGVPYSEHSSFRELTMFCCALRIEKIIPTVNVGSAKSRERMKGWCEKWAVERKKNGLFRLDEDGAVW